MALIPEQTIVVDESISVGHRFFPLTGGAAPHDWLNSVGASLGYALPVAIGAAIAAAGGRVVKFITLDDLLIRNIVVTIDNAPRPQMALNQRPIKPTPGEFVTAGPEEAIVLACHIEWGRRLWCRVGKTEHTKGRVRGRVRDLALQCLLALLLVFDLG